nr:transposase domain-containing protein [Prevotella sp.]
MNYSIRSLTAARNASLFFLSKGGIELLVVYHTFVEKCKMNGVPVLEYLRKVFLTMADGCEDYINLTSMAIMIK